MTTLSGKEKSDFEAVQDHNLLQWMTFRLAEEVYGLDVMNIKEVLRYTDIAPVPGAPDYVLGIINLRGNVVTVIDARTRFGLPSAEVTDDTRIVVIETEVETIGIMVDSVSEVIYLKDSEIEPPPNVGNDEMSHYIRGVCNRNDTLIILINLHDMVS
ncbi:chemotaxis protein CheW [Natronospirillum operosum]|uniref:Chemotaxis protein CheW n=1 Tax=Natronospirillum operosum TaxID=2759953 RepID=A0A4Z0WIG8_9GAMM|nr:chemotaxis protein CheW [Natronospirillum operosum]TGG94925.1 chemotaxis protein CheW [Natronospirillum operosum]